jgi:hypothetical protein
MSGITDSAKFNKNSSYYLEVDPPAGGGQIINGNLQVTGTTTLLGNNNALQVPNGSILANGVGSTNGYVSVSGGNATAATFPLGLTTAGGLTSQSNSSFLANILVSQGIYGANSSTLPNFPLGLLIEGQPLTTGITSASTAGGNNSWWVKFKAPGGTNSFAIIGGSGQFSGGGVGGMTINGPPFTTVISAVGGGIKGQTVIVSHDVDGDNGPAGQVKFFCTDTAGNPSGTGAIVNGFALVLCPP